MGKEAKRWATDGWKAVISARWRAHAEVSFLPALTFDSLWMKASAANVGAYELTALVSEDSSPLGQLVRLMASMLQLTKEQA